MTPHEAAAKVTDFCKSGLVDVDNWIITATVSELQEFTHYAITPHWLQRAQAALDILLSDQAAQSTNKLIQHTEKLTKQTDTHVQHAEKLTQQTDILITESRNLTSLTKDLKWFTIGLFALTAVLAFLTAGLLYIDWHREQEKQHQSTVWYPATQILTNLDSPVIKLDAAPLAGSLTIKGQCPTNPAIILSFTPDYYISNNCIVLPTGHFQLWHSILQTTNLQMRIYINYATNVRGQE